MLLSALLTFRMMGINSSTVKALYGVRPYLFHASQYNTSKVSFPLTPANSWQHRHIHWLTHPDDYAGQPNLTIGMVEQG
jgi:hypothetical protein